MKGASLTESIRPVRAQMDLDVGRLTVREAVQLVGFTVGLLFVATLGALLLWLVWPDYYQDWSGVRLVFASFAGSVVLFSGGMAVLVARLTIEDWKEYRLRLADWHAVAIEAYENNGGREVVKEMTVWDLTPSMTLHTLAVALACHRRAMQGTSAPWSVRELTGPIMLGGHRLGSVSKGAAEEFGRDLSTLGLIAGRGPGKAGQWAAQSEGEVIDLVVANWKRLGKATIEHDET
jgi:hypothetical protein